MKNTPYIENEYATYQEFAEELIKELASKIPGLLKDEPFFEKVFLKRRLDYYPYQFSPFPRIEIVSVLRNDFLST